jgi:branched-chain amino acid transport system substrate-binding protein
MPIHMRAAARRLALCAAGLVAGLVVASCSGSSGAAGNGLPPGPVKLGALFTLTGPNAAVGLAQEAMFQLLVTDLNAAGGIAGHQVDLIVLNDEGSPTAAVSQATVLVQEHVAAVVFAGADATLAQAVSVLARGHVPVVMPDPLDKWADGARYPYFFDTGPLDKQTASAMVRFASAKGVHKIGILGDGSPVSSQLDTDVTSASTGRGIAVVGTQTFVPTAPSVGAQLAQLRTAGAEGLVVSAQSGLATVYTGLRQLRWSPTILATSAADSVGYAALGPLAPNAFAACSVALRPGAQPSTALADVVQSAEAHIGSTPLAASALLYNDSLQIVKKAIAQAGSTNDPDLRSQIERLTAVSTTPPYTYTFTATHHGGWSSSNVHMCGLSGFGPYDLPVIASP